MDFVSNNKCGVHNTVYYVKMVCLSEPNILHDNEDIGSVDRNEIAHFVSPLGLE